MQRLTSTRIRHRLVLETPVLEGVFKKVLKKLRPGIQAPGFRKGRAPDTVIAKLADSKVLQENFIELALAEAIDSAIRELGIRPVGPPAVEITKFVPYSVLEANYETDVLPDIPAWDWQKYRQKLPEISVGEEEIAPVIENLRRNSAKRLAKKSPASPGDELIVTIRARDQKNQKLPVLDVKRYPLVLGQDSYLRGLDQMLIGAKAGQERELDLALEDDFKIARLAGQTVHLKIKTDAVNKLQVAKADDRWAAGLGPYKSLSDLINEIRQALHQQKRSTAAGKIVSQVIDALVRDLRFDVPQSIKADQRQNPEAIARSDQEQDGQDSERNARLSLILSAIAADNKLKISEEELAKRLAYLKQRYQSVLAKGYYDDPKVIRNIYQQMLNEKVAQYIFDSVT